LTFESSNHNYVLGLESTQNNLLRPLAQKGCAPLR